jgi:Flp pilus assembly protein TadG
MRRARRAVDPRVDAGATAVEFALVLPVLLLFLFGVIQYGYGLYQLQTFSTVLTDATRLAATGINDCGTFSGLLSNLADEDGLAGPISSIKVDWLTAAGAATDKADRLGLAQVTASYEPFDLGLPFLPFPSEVTRTQRVPIQDIGNPSLLGC